MNSIDSIYNKIIADIEKNLPVSIKRPSAVRYKGLSADVKKTGEASGVSFEKVLDDAVTAGAVDAVTTASVKAIDMRDVESRIEAAIIKAAEKYNIEYALIKGVIKAESSFNPYCVSHAGAMGLMQLMPANVEELGVNDPFNVEENIDAGTRHLRDMLDRFDNNVQLALAAYNAGPGNVNKYGGIPPFEETQNYVPRVLTYADSYR